MATPYAERAIESALRHGRAILKFISPNDVGLTGGHQCGYYLPKQMWRMFTPNPPNKGQNSESFPTVLWPDGRTTDSRIVWYGKGTRSEYRMTRFGRDFRYLTSDNVGDLLVVVPITYDRFEAYVLEHDDDFDQLQASLGVEFDGGATWVAYDASAPPQAETEDDCLHRHYREFATALSEFPTTATFAVNARDAVLDCLKEFAKLPADQQLQILVDCEYDLFKVVERRLCEPEIVRPFKSVDDFLKTANSILQRRKTRAGRSLENHVGYVFEQAGLPFEPRVTIEGNKQPDILIPGKQAYEDPSYPTERLFMIGVKRTCKDRWRQVLNEADRIKQKHILTLQPGISVNQLREMSEANIRLIVPKKLHAEYPPACRPELLTLDGFVTNLRETFGLGSTAPMFQ